MTTNHENNHTNTPVFADLLKANCYNMNEATLREIAYIGYIASEQGQHQQAACQGIHTG